MTRGDLRERQQVVWRLREWNQAGEMASIRFKTNRHSYQKQKAGGFISGRVKLKIRST
jgi:hypothetical protein